MTDTTHNSAVEAIVLALSPLVNEDMEPTMRAAWLDDLARAAIAAMPPQAPGWRPISEAPRDERILGYMPNRDNTGRPHQAVIFWDDQFRSDGWDNESDDVKFVGGWSAGRVGSFSYEEYAEEHPTHWQPLPTPPSDPLP